MKSRKIYYKVMTLIMTAFILTCNVACKRNQSDKPRYYDPCFFLVPYTNVEEPYLETDSSEPSKNQMTICNEVLLQIKKSFKVEKSDPKIRLMPDEYFNRSASMQATARYDHKTHTIYIPVSFDKSGRSAFCHEVFHYLSDTNNGYVGLEYMIDGTESNKYLMGSALNEGITNYFGIKILKHPQGTSVYEFETHIAEQIALAIGDNYLWYIYTAGNWEKLKNIFNDTLTMYPTEKYENDNLRLTPFEMFQLSLDEYSFLLRSCDDIVNEFGYDEWFTYFQKDVLSSEEMALRFAKSQAKAKANIISLINNSSGHLDFSILEVFCD